MQTGPPTWVTSPVGVELAGLLVDAEVDDGVAVLVGGVQERAARIDGEVARRLALRRLVADRRQPAVAWSMAKMAIESWPRLET